MRNNLPLFVLATWLVCAACVQAEDVAVAKKTPAWLKYCNERIAKFVIEPTRKEADPFRRIAEPVLQHTHPARDGQLGAVYMWVTKIGRPAVVGTVFVVPDEDGKYVVVDEFRSLHDETLKSKFVGGGPTWETRSPGLDWSPLANASEPKTRFAAMTGQARSLSREFAGVVVELETERERPLRILPNPIYKYDLGDDESEQAMAGFVFAGCLDTDPECFLCLEVRKTDEGAKWFHAFAWFSNRAVAVERNAKPVWVSDPDEFEDTHTANVVRGIVIPK